jgi:uncharacterized protein YciW
MKRKNKLTFKPIISTRKPLRDQFDQALKAADHVTMIEGISFVTFKLRKRKKQ